MGGLWSNGYESDDLERPAAKVSKAANPGWARAAPDDGFGTPGLYRFETMYLYSSLHGDGQKSFENVTIKVLEIKQFDDNWLGGYVDSGEYKGWVVLQSPGGRRKSGVTYLQQDSTSESRTAEKFSKSANPGWARAAAVWAIGPETAPTKRRRVTVEVEDSPVTVSSGGESPFRPRSLSAASAEAANRLDPASACGQQRHHEGSTASSVHPATTTSAAPNRIELLKARIAEKQRASKERESGTSTQHVGSVEARDGDAGGGGVEPLASSGWLRSKRLEAIQAPPKFQFVKPRL